MFSRYWNNLPQAVCFLAVLLTFPAVLQAQSPEQAIAPIFSLSANGLTSGQVYQGWALLFDAELSHPNLYSTKTIATPLVIEPSNGSWANNIHLLVKDSTGGTQNWPIQLMTIPPGAAVLDATNVARMAWVVAPSDTAAIAAGSYRVVGILDTTASANTTGWRGNRKSGGVSIQIAASPASPTASQQEQQLEMLAHYHNLVGNTSQALMDLNELLASYPNALGALAFKGILLDQTGQTAEALAVCNDAVNAFYAANNGTLQEPPDGLLILQGTLQSKLLSQSGVRGRPQIDIRLLSQGIESPGVFFMDLQITNVGNDVAENVLLKQFDFRTLSGTGLVTLNNVVSPQLPIFTDFLSVNGAATVRIFVTVPAPVNSFSITENGTTADIFGTPYSFSQTQTVSTNVHNPLGDVNGDGVVNCADITIVKASFGKKTGQTGFDARADLNKDGIVNIIDLATVARQLPPGTACP